ncbi:protachykinin-1 isoform X2 [Ambystoma mexicanum]|uniref:protachykinin-1 isoform X2 n=1 Tax=Ambystoma mexicanum TaxID=8296 RepID=UPI0037E7B495
MRVLVALAVLLLVSAQVFADDLGLSEESDWPYTEQLQDELQGPLIEHFLQRIARKPRPDQFYGLMGKRTTGLGQIPRKRSFERNTMHNYERRRK